MKSNIGNYVVEHGDVWFEPNDGPARISGFANKTHVCDGSEELAIAIVDDAMVKCGNARSVETWVERRAAGFDVTIIRFPVSIETVAELNACLHNSTRARSLVDHLTEIGRNNPGLAAKRSYPR